MIGTHLSHFRILSKIDEGGMGVVYKAMDEKLQRHVALKILPPDLVADPDRRARFLREARAAAAITHPNIATIYEVDESDGVIFIAMELIEGETLETFLEREVDLPFLEILDIAIHLVEGLSEAHSRRIAHLDLKPKNVMIGPQGRVKILDFGLARPLRPSEPVLGPASDAKTISIESIPKGGISGTVHYMSPEQAMGKPLDESSDLFSFGVMLYEMATGKLPFQGENVTAIIAKILESQPLLPTAIKSDLPSGLDLVISRCLEKDPDRRYNDAGEILADLRELRETVPQDRSIPGLAREPAASISPTKIAVFPFSIRGSGEHAYLREGLVDLISTKLDGAGDLHCVDPHVVLCCSTLGTGGTPDLERALETARRFGAGLFVLGNVLEIGENLHLDASLYESKDDLTAVGRVTAQGKASEIFGMVDDLVAKLLAERCGGPNARFTRIATMTTESFPALKAYLEGENQMRAMRRISAVEAFERAVAADAGFALAWYRLSVAALWSGQPGKAGEAIQKAERYSDRLSDRDRQLVEAFQAVLRGANDEAERLYRIFVGTYPDDVEAWYQLGEILFHHGPMRGRSIVESRKAWERLHYLDPTHINALAHLGAIAASEGNRVEVESMTRRALDLSRGGDSAIWMRALKAFALGDRAGQKALMADLEKTSDYNIKLVLLFVGAYLGDINGAGMLTSVLTDPVRAPGVRARGYLLRSHLELARGRWTAAKRDLDAARKLHPVIGLEYRALLSAAPFLKVPAAELRKIDADLQQLPLETASKSGEPGTWLNPHQGLHRQLRVYLLGLISARLGSPDATLAAAGKLEKMGDLQESGHLVTDLALSLRAMAARHEDRVEEALHLLEQARMEARFDQAMLSPFYSQAFERFARGELLTDLDRHREAIPWFGSFAENSLYDLIFLAPSHRKRGAIHERLGEPEKAIEHYSRFLELWHDCDPELRDLFRRTEARMARLKRKIG